MATTAAKTFKNFIGGEWVDAASGETFETTSPATGETLGVVPALRRRGRRPRRRGGEGRVRGLAARARRRERGEILFRFGQLLAEHKDELADLMTHEMGKVLRRGRAATSRRRST